jgi:outer membrane protein assembly factor BamB
MASKTIFTRLGGVACAGLFMGLAAGAADWPQILGPTRNGVYTGNDLANTWPKEGPPVVWQKKIGQGFAGPAVALGKLILFHRLGDKETVECLRAADGKPVWSFEYATGYQDRFGFDEGPRAVPCIANGKVYTFGAEGALHCLDFSDGKKLWNLDVKKQFGSGNGFFGMACSPVVEGNAVILNIGGRDGAGIVALNAETGRLLWKATDDEASYSSPVVATVEGKRTALVFSRSGLFGLEAATGKQLFNFPWRPAIDASVSAALPLVIGDEVFISASYDTGAALLRMKGNGVEKEWTGDESLSNQYATGVYREGFLYGLDGRHDFPAGTELRCVELKTGKVKWGKPGLKGANVMLAGDQLLVLAETGELIRVAAAPDKYQETGRAQILGTGVRAYPALAEGLFYGRSKDRMVAVDLRKK